VTDDSVALHLVLHVALLRESTVRQVLAADIGLVIDRAPRARRVTSFNA
jgi:hypothetical protein